LKKFFFFCFIPMKISPNLYGRMRNIALYSLSKNEDGELCFLKQFGCIII
jgi:hypothetical protein